MNDSNSRAFIQQLDSITDPDLRAQVKEQFKIQHMGEDLEHFIRHCSDWNNNGDGRDAKAALQLISTERDDAETKLAEMEFMQFAAHMQRVLFTSEAVRSPTQLSDLALTFDIMQRPGADQGDFSTVRDMAPTAFAPGEENGKKFAGGAPGAGGALDAAEGGARGNNANKRAVDQAIRRHLELLAMDPEIQMLAPADRERVMVNRIRGMLGL